MPMPGNVSQREAALSDVPSTKVTSSNGIEINRNIWASLL
jgi:hypothetical protein